MATELNSGNFPPTLEEESEEIEVHSNEAVLVMDPPAVDVDNSNETNDNGDAVVPTAATDEAASDRVDASLDPVAGLWSTIYQICSIIAVENLDEGLSMPGGLIMTTKELLTVMPLSFSLLGIVDLVIYTVLVELAEKRRFHVAERSVARPSDADNKGEGGEEDQQQQDQEEEEEEDDEEDSPLADYCHFLRLEVVPILNAKFTGNGILSLVVKLVDEFFSCSCRFSVQFDPNFVPLNQFISHNTPTGPILALADRAMNDMYDTLCGNHHDSENNGFCYRHGDFKSHGHLNHEEWQRVVGESCSQIEECVRGKYPGAVVIPCGSATIPGTSTSQSDIDMLLVCSDIVHQNDLHWEAKESIEDDYIALVEEGKMEYNHHATEVAANKILEKCVRNIQEYVARHEQQLAMYNNQYAQYQQYVMMQQQHYSAYGSRRPLQAPPPMPVKPLGITMFFTAEDMQLMTTVVRQGVILMEGVIPQTLLFQSYMSLIVDYFEDLSTLFSKFLGKTDPARREYENQMHLNNNKTLSSIKHLLEPLVVVDSEFDSPESRHYMSAANRAKNARSGSSESKSQIISRDLVLRGGSLGASGARITTQTATAAGISHTGVSGNGRQGSSDSTTERFITDLKLNMHGRPTVLFTDNKTNRKCKLEINQLISIKNSELLKTYLDMDRSGVVRKYVALVKLFAQAHKICSASDGYLSSYGWTVMALHVLLRYRLIPCITPQALSAQHFCKGVDVSFVDSMTQLPVAFESRLRQVGLIQLLYLFFHYYSKVFDIEGEIVSLRRPTMPKLSQTGSRMHAQSWRFSIEDPFQTADSLFSVDLGSSLVNYTKQASIFKTLNLARKGIEISMAKSTIGYNGTINFLRSGIESIFDPTSIDRWQYA